MLQLILFSCAVLVVACRYCEHLQKVFIWTRICHLQCVITEMSVKNTPDKRCHILYRIVTTVLMIAFVLLMRQGLC